MLNQSEILVMASSFILSFVLLIMLGNFTIPALQELLKPEEETKVNNARTALEHHIHKIGTLPIGGVLIILASFGGFYLFGKMNNLIGIIVFALVSNACLGLVDDYTKRNNNQGLKAKIKFFFQLIIYVLPVYLIHDTYLEEEVFTTVYLPIVELEIPLGYGYYLFAIFVVLGCSNAVNLTDGLDGLAGFPLILNYLFAALMCIMVSSHLDFDQFSYSEIFESHTNNPSRITAQNYYQLALLCVCIAGGLLGFLWFNCYPAKIFMGDNGSLSLGATLGLIYIVLKKEFLLIFAGLPFVIETLSVILQVIYFRVSGGKRLFEMSPLHHHYEKLGFDEVTIVSRFWILSIISIFMTVIILITQF